MPKNTLRVWHINCANYSVPIRHFMFALSPRCSRLNKRIGQMSETKPNTGAMTVPEFLDWARIGRTTFYREAAAGRIKLRKIGAKTVILRSDALAWLSDLPVAEVSAA